MWEYKKIDLKYKTHIDLNESLNKLGSEGWEIISFEEAKTESFARIGIVHILMKRQKSTITPTPEILTD